MSKPPVALVTGGSRGIGRAICIEIASRGFYTIINFRSGEKQAQETLDAVKQAGGDGEICGFDVCSFEQTTQALDGIFKNHGAVDALVNNAGVTADGLFPMMSRQSWDKVLSTTLDGFFNVTKPVVKKMIRKRKGAIVSVASVSAFLPNKGQTNYSAAKAGLIGASRSLAAEMAKLNIRVNVVAPGLIETEMLEGTPTEAILPMIPMARLGKPEEVAKTTAFLLSDDASYITGQVIGINGGMI